MLKKRVIACLVVKDGIVVQSIGFKKYLPVGKPAIAVEFLNQWGIDEIILVDITATKQGREPNFKMFRELSQKCYVPLTIGGGITKVEHVSELMHCGADKFSINKTALQTPEFITKTAHIYGNQCVVVSIDVLKGDDGQYRVYDYTTRAAIDKNPVQWAKEAEELGAGEIFLTSVNRDGSYLGYDIEMVQQVAAAVSIPVIASGGAKNALDFKKVFDNTGAMAASAANFFHFTEHSVVIAKTALVAKNSPVRLETYANYTENPLDSEFRVLKKEDKTLEEMLFMRIEKEII
ncbi:MAG TPA: imidazole glycerol phosphate synthase cyclase subunit [Bacteroidia bacterium]|nr:imidazole glycerol phosphate synthase cyclase subunit [Bacteroidia bacterium]